MLTSPHREHKRGGRGRGPGREPPGAGEATVADAHAEGSTSADWSAAGEANVAGKKQDVLVVRGMAWRQHSQPREEGAGSPAGAGLGGWSRKNRD